MDWQEFGRAPTDQWSIYQDGFFIPPMTGIFLKLGPYKFFMTGDDYHSFHLSTDPNVIDPSKLKQLIYNGYKGWKTYVDGEK